MVTLFDAEGRALRTYNDVIRFDRRNVEFINQGYRGIDGANTLAGEYIDDPDNPITPEPEPQPDPAAQEMIDIMKGVIE